MIVSREVQKNSTNTTFSDLKPKIGFSYKIRAENACGKGNFSENITATKPH